MPGTDRGGRQMARRARACVGGAILVLAALLAGVPAAAQSDSAGATPLSEAVQAATPGNESNGKSKDVSSEDVEQLIQRLEDPEQRDALIQDLRVLLEAQKRAREDGAQQKSGEKAQRAESREGPLAFLGEKVRTLYDEFDAAAGAVLAVPAALVEAADALVDPEVRQVWFEILGKIALTLAAGFAAEWAVRHGLLATRRRIADRAGAGLLLREVLRFTRNLLDVLPVAAFAAAAYLLLPALSPRGVTEVAALALIHANVLARVVVLVSYFLLAPQQSDLRLAPINDQTAAYLHIWIRRYVRIGVYGFFALEAGRQLGLPDPAYAFLAKLLGLLLAGMAIVLVQQNRRAVALWLRVGGREAEADSESHPHPGSDAEPAASSPDDESGDAAAAAPRSAARPSWLRRRLAAAPGLVSLWHIVATALIAALYLTWALEVPNGFAFLARGLALTAAVFVLAALALRGARAGFDRLFAVSAGYRDRFPGLEARANRYLPALRRVADGLVFAVAALALLQAWGVGAAGWLLSDTGTGLLADIATVGLVIGLAFLVWEAVSGMIERALAHASEEEGQRGASSRMLTLLPLLRNVVRIVLVLIAVMIVMSELGVDIAPLLAGAGVVGLAIGFGAQALVRDVITGAFILVENSLAVGDWVEAGGHEGTVEALTIRTLTLRDLSGTVHVIPFGDVTSVKNYNRDHGFAIVDAGVAYRERYEDVVDALEEAERRLREDPVFGPEITGPLEVFGLQEFADSAVVVRVRLRTKPLRQFAVRRAYHRYIKAVFDERGIEIPFPHRTLYFGVDKDGDAPPLRLARGADPRRSADGGEGDSASGSGRERTIARTPDETMPETGDGDEPGPAT